MNDENNLNVVGEKNKSASGVWSLLLIFSVILVGTVLFYVLPYPHSISWQYYALMAVVPALIGGTGVLVTSVVGIFVLSGEKRAVAVISTIVCVIAALIYLIR